MLKVICKLNLDKLNCSVYIMIIHKPVSCIRVFIIAALCPGLLHSDKLVPTMKQHLTSNGGKNPPDSL